MCLLLVSAAAKIQFLACGRVVVTLPHMTTKPNICIFKNVFISYTSFLCKWSKIDYIFFFNIGIKFNFFFFFVFIDLWISCELLTNQIDLDFMFSLRVIYQSLYIYKIKKQNKKKQTINNIHFL